MGQRARPQDVELVQSILERLRRLEIASDGVEFFPLAQFLRTGWTVFNDEEDYAGFYVVDERVVHAFGTAYYGNQIFHDELPVDAQAIKDDPDRGPYDPELAGGNLINVDFDGAIDTQGTVPLLPIEWAPRDNALFDVQVFLDGRTRINASLFVQRRVGSTDADGLAVFLDTLNHWTVRTGVDIDGITGWPGRKFSYTGEVPYNSNLVLDGLCWVIDEDRIEGSGT